MEDEEIPDIKDLMNDENFNTVKINCFSFGIQRFNVIRIKDEQDFLNLLDESENSEIFAKKFILNQLKNENITLTDLDSLNSNEIIQIISDFMDNNEYVKLNFDFNDKKNFYLNFENGIKNYLYRFNSEIENHLESISRLVQPYHDLILQHQISGLNFYEGYISQLSYVSNQYIDLINSIDPFCSLNSVMSSISSITNLQRLLEPQINIWSDWISAHENIFNSFLKNWEYLNKIFKDNELSLSETISYLKKYHWFITPNMSYDLNFKVLAICKDGKKHKRSRINKAFNDYFLDNNCEVLEEFVENWSSDPIFEKRMKILRDCVKLIQNTPKNVNFANLVVPVLITQIDGIQKDFMEFNHLNVNHRKKTVEVDGEIIKEEDFFKGLTEQDYLMDSINDIFLNVLFQHTFPGEDYSASIHLSRHKILHGENIKYGRKDYAIRCFMILDFLHMLEIS